MTRNIKEMTKLYLWNEAEAKLRFVISLIKPFLALVIMIIA